MVISPLEEKRYNNNNNNSNNMTSPQMTLRHEAAKRAMAAQQNGSPYSQQHSSYRSPPPSHDQNQNHYQEPHNAYKSTSSSEIGGSPPLARYHQQKQNLQEQQVQVQRPQQRQPQQSRSPAPSYTTNTPKNENYFSDDTGSYDTEDNNSNVSPEKIAQSARKEWRRHGSGLTQVLEENRRGDERAGTFSVRVLSAETRRDVVGAQYTSYIIRVQLPSGNVLQMEHRYSHFAKLNETLKSHQIRLDAAFPSKHWAGRMGSWTPSMKWAPEQYHELIHYRKIQLDVWMVSVVRLYNLGDLPHSLAGVVYDFLTVPNRPPCEHDNSTDENWKWNNPLSFTLGSSIRQAASTLQHMCHNDPLTGMDHSIPLDLLSSAKGLCFLTVVKAGLVVSGRIGTGLLIARLSDHQWSAPCALGTVGMGWGMLAGADFTHYLVVLTTHDAVEAMLHGTVQLGAELGVAVGPVGRGATSQVSAANDNKWALYPAYSYAHSQGLFAGISLEGSVLSARHDVNAKFYSRNISPEQILDLPCPKAADPLYKALARAMATEIPEGSFRPSQLFQRAACKMQGRTTSYGSTSSVTQSPIHGLPTIDTVGPGPLMYRP